MLSQKNLHIFAVHWSGPRVSGGAGVTDGAVERKSRKIYSFQFCQKFGPKQINGWINLALIHAQ